MRATLAAAALVLAGPAPGQAPPLGIEDDWVPPPFTLDRARPLPDSLLRWLESGSEVHRRLATRFTCSERIVHAGESVRAFDYLLLETERGELEEVRLRRGRRREVAATGPPAYEWSLLFEPSRRGRFVFRHLGEALDQVHLVERIAFRGNTSYGTGRELSEWEGVAALKAGTSRLHRVDAAPRIYAERFPFERERYRKSLKLSVGLFVPFLDTLEGPADGFLPLLTLGRWRRPSVRLLSVEFRDLAPGLPDVTPGAVALPVAVDWRRYRLGRDLRSLNEVARRARRYDGCRFFRVDDHDPRFASWDR